jgi:DNA-binding transcriptional MerR regulator
MYRLTDNKKFIAKHLPGWSVLIDRFTERNLKSRDLQKILGLTYRQLSDWEKNRDVMKFIMERPDTKKAKGWRRFSLFDLIPLSILVELKKQGIPVSRIKELVKKMILPELLNYELLPNIVYGLDAYFMTNFESLIAYEYIEPTKKQFELNKKELAESKIMIVIPINPIIDNIFNKLDNQNMIIHKDKNNRYNFIINGIPLALEQLENESD